MVRDLCEELSRVGARRFADVVDQMLATMACHGSIRAGDTVNAQEVQALLEGLDEADFAGHCPHGRPIVLRLSFGELERRVGR
jgi:DNA mismatch repair protein MutL